MDAVTVAQRYIEEAWNRGNVAVLDEVFAPTYVDHNAPPGLPPGREGAKRLITAFRSAFPDFTVTIEDVIAAGDRVALRLTARATQTGTFQNIAPTGRRVTIGAIHILRATDGVIAESWEQFDALGLLQQLGAIPS